MRKLIFNRILPRLYYILFGINMLQSEFSLGKDEKCLCLAPHPDDESIGCGGIISLYPENFKVICLTDGSRAGSNLSKEELIKKRADEFNEAMKIAGVENAEMLGIQDRKLVLNVDIYEKIDISEYDYIFIPNILDQHRDHKSTAVVLNTLLRKKQHKKTLKVVFYEVWATLMMPTSYVDISGVVEKKKQMINAHSSQLQGFDYTEKMLCLNSYRGLISGKQYAEAFQIIDIPMFRKILKSIAI